MTALLDRLVIALFFIKKKALFWVGGLGSLIGALYFGFKDAGSYRGYSAGSLLSPDKYELTAYGMLTNSAVELDNINLHLDALRSESLPFFAFFLILFIAVIIGAVIVASVYGSLVSDADLIGEQKQAHIEAYEAKHGSYQQKNILNHAFDVDLTNYLVMQGLDKAQQTNSMSAQMKFVKYLMT